MERLGTCLVCGNDAFEDFLIAQDHYKKDYFNLQKCASCGFVFTNPRPSLSEIGDFYTSTTYLSHTSHDRSFMRGVYRAARKYMMNKKHEMLQEYTKGKKQLSILDFGCGTGDFLKFCSTKGHRVAGYEVEEHARMRAKEINGIEPYGPDQMDAIKFGAYDVITLWHVLEHVHMLNEQVDLFRKWLLKDGILVLALPNIESYDAEMYKEHWEGLDVPRHLYHFSPSAVDNLLVKHGFEKLAIRPLVLDAYYSVMYSERNAGKGNLYSMVKGVFSGFQLNKKAADTGKYSSLAYFYKLKSVGV